MTAWTHESTYIYAEKIKFTMDSVFLEYFYSMLYGLSIFLFFPIVVWYCFLSLFYIFFQAIQTISDFIINVQWKLSILFKIRFRL